MDVYLVPVGLDRHELYCEVPDEPEDATDRVQPQGFFRRLKVKFNTMLAAAERERRQERAAQAAGEPSPDHRKWLARINAGVMRWVAESIAEQRLLWHLRQQTRACLFYPADIDEATATSLLKAQLRRDFEKHRFWLTIDSLLFVGSGVFFFVPGPNIVAYYFGFRVVGHYLSMRGASSGLSVIEWTAEPSAPLAELRRAITLEPAAREERVQDVALKLRLDHLATFLARTAVPSA